jgi:hypothetical protein
VNKPLALFLTLALSGCSATPDDSHREPESLQLPATPGGEDEFEAGLLWMEDEAERASAKEAPTTYAPVPEEPARALESNTMAAEGQSRGVLESGK